MIEYLDADSLMWLERINELFQRKQRGTIASAVVQRRGRPQRDRLEAAAGAEAEDRRDELELEEAS